MKRTQKVVLALVMTCTVFLFTLGNRNLPRANYTTEAKAECVMELHSGRILYEKSGEEKLPIASTTKIVTAIAVL